MGLQRDDLSPERLSSARLVVFGGPRDKFSAMEARDSNVFLHLFAFRLNTSVCALHIYKYIHIALPLARREMGKMEVIKPSYAFLVQRGMRRNMARPVVHAPTYTYMVLYIS